VSDKLFFICKNIKTGYPDEEKELLKVYTYEKRTEIYKKAEDLSKGIK